MNWVFIWLAALLMLYLATPVYPNFSRKGQYRFVHWDTSGVSVNNKITDPD